MCSPRLPFDVTSTCLSSVLIQNVDNKVQTCEEQTLPFTVGFKTTSSKDLDSFMKFKMPQQWQKGELFQYHAVTLNHKLNHEKHFF